VTDLRMSGLEDSSLIDKRVHARTFHRPHFSSLGISFTPHSSSLGLARVPADTLILLHDDDDHTCDIIRGQNGALNMSTTIYIHPSMFTEQTKRALSTPTCPRCRRRRGYPTAQPDQATLSHGKCQVSTHLANSRSITQGDKLCSCIHQFRIFLSANPR
jgi:hypothetical protein